MPKDTAIVNPNGETPSLVSLDLDLGESNCAVRPKDKEDPLLRCPTGKAYTNPFPLKSSVFMRSREE
jgi:hypothetical protein